MAQLTPMMKQYMDIKSKYQDAILFYRLGDFYEMFFGDAKEASNILGLTLTGRDCGQVERAPMCGIPFHSADPYIIKLVSKGYKVAICEQTEDPTLTKDIVKREVIRVITPGTITLTDMLDESKNNFLISICKNNLHYSLSATDVTTGEFYSTQFLSEFAKTDVLNEIARYSPSEIICNQAMFEEHKLISYVKDKYSSLVQNLDDLFEKHSCEEALLQQFNSSIAKLEMDDKPLLVLSAGALVSYLQKTQMTQLEHISKLSLYSNEQFMRLDETARRNLELTAAMRDKGKKGSLLGILDKTKTSMGARMLRSWIEQPLIVCSHITQRAAGVEELSKKQEIRGLLREELKNIKDMERLVSKIDYGSANGRDLVSLKQSAECFPTIKEIMSKCESPLVLQQLFDFDLLEDIKFLIDSAIVDDPPFSIREGGIIKEGFDPIIDGWKKNRDEGKSMLHDLECKEREETGIKNLKIGFNKVFGFYIEVTKSYFDLVPQHYIRKQTLANCERYITATLKEIEDIVLRSDEKIIAKEYQIFCEVKDAVKQQMERIQKSARILSVFDVLSSLAETAVRNNYIKPDIDMSGEIDIKDGRHPVVESMLTDTIFVPNDTKINQKENLLSIITGPNMAGKSTYMRQVALIVIMAQMGSFIPASFARIGIVDKIFTRIGASDDLSAGQSTFMVEMTEVSYILKNATKNSLLILDEIGRGTSTYDGLSIAWSVIEYVADAKKLGAKTLFATHYHELSELEDQIEGVVNYCIAAKKRKDDIVFLRKIIKGHADESYGIEVAKLAGVPSAVVNRAKNILTVLEEAHKGKQNVSVPKAIEVKPTADNGQMGFSNLASNEILDMLSNIDVNILTPIEALNKLFELKRKAETL